MLGFLPLNETIAIKRTSLDDWGMEVPNGIEKYYRVRVDYDTAEVKLSIGNGSETVITGAVIFVGEVEIRDDDVIEVDGKDYSPKRVTPMKDFGGTVIHTKVLF
jgi:hypothetical protein